MQIILYTLLIYPIESIIELVFLVAFKIFNENVGGAIVVVSLFINIATSPIYAAADVWQKKEKALQKKLKHKIDSFVDNELYKLKLRENKMSSETRVL